MPRTPKICGQQGCLQTATTKGKCPTHAPAPFEGARDRWNSSRPPRWAATRQRVIKAAQGRCEMCGGIGHQVDHIQPVAEGGSWELPNLRLLCTDCHKIKSRKDAQRGRRNRRT